jgi:hypothetical protein
MTTFDKQSGRKGSIGEQMSSLSQETPTLRRKGVVSLELLDCVGRCCFSLEMCCSMGISVPALGSIRE